MSDQELKVHLSAFFWGKVIPREANELSDLIIEALKTVPKPEAKPLPELPKSVLSRRDTFAFEFSKLFINQEWERPLTSAVEFADALIEKLDNPNET